LLRRARSNRPQGKQVMSCLEYLVQQARIVGLALASDNINALFQP